MSTVERATISLPAPLMRALKAEAAKRGMTLSALLAEKARLARPRPSWFGMVDDDPDLSLKFKEIMRRGMQREQGPE